MYVCVCVCAASLCHTAGPFDLMLQHNATIALVARHAVRALHHLCRSLLDSPVAVCVDRDAAMPAVQHRLDKGPCDGGISAHHHHL
jgi:hypothetical protein